MDWINIALLSTALLNIILGLLIIFSGKDRRVSKAYFWNIIAIIGWIIAMMFYRSARVDETALFWCTFLYIVPTIIASSFLYFTYIFPTQIESKLGLRPLAIFGINLIVIALVAVPGLIIQEVNLRPGLEHEIIFTRYYIIYFLYTLFFFSFGFLCLTRKILKASGSERNQILYLLFGYALAANLAFVTNLVMPWFGYFFLNWLGQVFTVFMVAFTVYAVIVHRLMDIKMVMRTSSVYIVSIIMTMLLVVGIKFVISEIVPQWRLTADLLALVLAVSVYNPIRERCYRLANRYFFTTLYDPQTLIGQLGDRLRLSLLVERIHNVVWQTLDKALHLERFGVLGLDDRNGNYVVAFNKGFPIGRKRNFSGNKVLYDDFIRQGKIMVVEEAKEKYGLRGKEFKKMFDLFDNMRVEVVVPLNVKNRPSGLLVLGPKETGDMYNDEDLKMLAIVASQIAISLENAKLYQETERFNEVLRNKVKEATKDLQTANQELQGMNEKLQSAYAELQRLDQAKSEFINIASHQLRTPISVIKSLISFLRNGDIKQFDKEQEQHFYESAWSKCRKLESIVEDILNANALNSGKFKITGTTAKKINLREFFNEIANDFVPEIEERELTLKVKPIDKRLAIVADQKYFEEAINNLVNNAIKYTPSRKKTADVRAIREGDGIITLSAEKDKTTPGNVLIKVADNGIGIAVEEIPKIFRKFERAENARNMYTDGSGLGLYIVKEIIEGHGGRIWVESQLNKGTTFFISVPIHPDFDPDIEQHLIDEASKEVAKN